MSSTKVPVKHQGLLVPGVFRTDVAEPTASTAVTELNFTALVKIDDKEVPLRSGNLLDLAESGIMFEVPAGTIIELGSLETLVNWFAKEMDLQPVKWEDLPETLRKITSAKASIDKLFVQASPKIVTFDIIVTLTFEDWNIIGNISLKSFSFELLRKQKEEPTPP